MILLRFIYDFFLFLFLLLTIPKSLGMVFLKKKYQKSLLYRLGLKKITFPILEYPVIWIHAVSLGEVKASLPFILEIIKSNPKASILLSSVTEAGLNEAKKFLPSIIEAFFLPFDFSFIIKPLVKKIKPDLVIFIEGDLWPNFLSAAKECNAKTIIINGKISNTSLKRYIFFKTYQKWVFSQIDYVCAQNAQYFERFKKLGFKEGRLSVTGNMKFDFPLKKESEEVLEKTKHSVGFSQKDFIITIGSTHKKEEDLLLEKLSALLKKYVHLKVCIIPRHAYRFKKVEELLVKKGFSYLLWSNRDKLSKESNILLVDALGTLNLFYQIADLAIVGGSFVDIGGHNILEPICYGKPTVFGPYMKNQQEFSLLSLEENVAKQLKLEDLPLYIESILQGPKEMLKTERFFEKNRGASVKNWDKAKNLLDHQI